ncbi:type II secretion system minor pseudopilin GspK [Pseudoduganella sp. FT93W]|uniref:Type II secretion system protein K n=1 Tax=Duganella fentianensis TaxID=2692177 RepID=A0A845HYG2_9BURK|nr:type II secretion system minor pseudopilin GspK [Duganella fentianensis]MYN46424.1 type II secretion system minor pseudopilin GspK [Duganella fentianensis]
MMRRRESGVAVVTALLLTTLAVTIVASLFWQQQVQVRSMENQRLQLQTRWIVRGALDLSRLVLYQDFIDSSGQTRLNGVWATPLEETRLDDYIERERAQAENFNATLSGRMMDAQSRYNLANLVKAGQRAPDPQQVAAFQRLLKHVQLDPALAQTVATTVVNALSLPTLAQEAAGNAAGGAAASAPLIPPNLPAGGTANPQPAGQQASGPQPLGMLRVEDLLAISGFTPAAIERLRELVIVLPERTDLNVNTAPAELLAAAVDRLSLADAATLVNVRRRTPFQNRQNFEDQMQMFQNGALKANIPVDVKSNYFLALSKVKLDRATLDTVSLLKRAGNNGATTVLWIREN